VADETHAQILANPPALRLPPEPPRDIPFVGMPSCPTNCSGKHQTDGVIVCRVCHGEQYRVVLHEWPHNPGHSWIGLEPMNGASPKMPGQALQCCGTAMRRVFR
jgi:hypothetical protein